VSAPRLARAALIAAANGSRSLIGLGALALAGAPRGPLHRRAVRTPLVVASGAELVIDKLPSTPSRLRPAGLAPRVALGAACAAQLWRRDPSARPGATVAVGALGGALAFGAAHAGARWRALAATRWGSDLPGAVVEDGVALTLALIAAFPA
jgi:uncharacterized membrane protein